MNLMQRENRRAAESGLGQTAIWPRMTVSTPQADIQRAPEPGRSAYAGCFSAATPSFFCRLVEDVVY
jgi:hypothetical protein